MIKVAVIPIYNEAANLERILTTFGARMDITIAVNDGSTDASRSILTRWIAGQRGSYFIDKPANRGKGSALKDGFALAALLRESGALANDDLLYTFDADGQHTVDSIEKLAERAVSDKLDMLLTRRDFSRYPRFKRVGNWGLSRFASLLGRYRYHDVECGLRVIRVGALPDLLAYYIGYKYSCEQELGILAASLGYRIDNSYKVEVPYYRAGTKVPDGIINVSLGLAAWIRLQLGLRSPHSSLTRRLQQRRILVGPGAALPPALRSPSKQVGSEAGGAPAPLPLKLDR